MTGLSYKDNFSRVFDYTGEIEAFVIPKNATFLHIWAIGAGTNGGAGASRTAGTAGGGGGGGATGAIVTMLIPTRFLPSTLYIVVGKGGGLSTDGYTKVMFRRGDSLGVVVSDSLLLANTGASNGGAGTAVSAGTAASIAGYSLQNNAYAGLSTLTITAGQAGELGGAITGAVGASKNPAFTFGMPFTGGAGGAGCTTTDFAGGAIIPTSNAQQQSGVTLAGGLAGGGDGLNGLQFEEPFTCYGGSGGGSNNSGVGGKGGDGAIGCGGGGGGAGVTGGAGGRGGNGRVVITWF